MPTVFIGIDAFSAVGGIQQFNRRLIRALGRAADSDPQAVRALVLRDRPEDIPELPGVTVQGFSGNQRRFIAALLALRPDRLLIGHANLLPVAMLAKLFCPNMRSMLMAHGIDVWNEPPLEWPLLRRFALRSTTKIAAVSHHTAARMGKAFGIPPSKFVCLPNAVDWYGMPTWPDTRRSRVLCVSRLGDPEEGKNLEMLVKAAALVRMAKGNFHLDIVGEGPGRASLESLIDEYGIADRVTLHGRVSQDRIQALYARASLFALPSFLEGFGIVYLEAWREGLPVLCSSGGAAPELVTDGIDGWVVAPDDAQGIAKAMESALQDPKRAREMGMAGADKVQERYSDTVFDQNVKALIAQL